MHKFIGRFAGFVIGCILAIAAAPFMVLADGSTADPAEVIIEQAQEDDGHWVPLGEYKLTFYCNCRKCCGKWSGGPTASGTMPVQGRTVACGSLPLGTHIIIEGMGEFVVEDRGVRGRHIDVFMNSHSECLRNGVKHAEVFRWVED